MIYRVNKIEDLSKIESEISTEAVIVIDKVLPYNCSGVMFKTNKGWSRVFLDSTQLNTDATINGSLTLTEGITIGTNLTGIGATDIDLGFTDNFTIDGNDTVDSKVTIENVDDVNITANEEIVINAPLVTVTGDFVYTPKTYTWNDTNDYDAIPTDVDIIIVDVTISDVTLYFPTPFTVGKKFTVVTSGPLLSSNKLYLATSFGALINGDSAAAGISVNDMRHAVGVGDG